MAKSYTLHCSNVNADIERIVLNGDIVSPPKVLITFYSRDGIITREALLNIGAKCNVLLTELAKKLIIPIMPSNKNFFLTASGLSLKFYSTAVINTTIREDFRCDSNFFLLDKAPKILLGQPFL